MKINMINLTIHCLNVNGVNKYYFIRNNTYTNEGGNLIMSFDFLKE